MSSAFEMHIPAEVREVISKLPKPPSKEDICKIWIPILQLLLPFPKNDYVPGLTFLRDADTEPRYALDVEHNQEHKYTALTVTRVHPSEPIDFIHFVCASEEETEENETDPWAKMTIILRNRIERTKESGLDVSRIPVYGVVAIGDAIRRYELALDGGIDVILDPGDATTFDWVRDAKERSSVLRWISHTGINLEKALYPTDPPQLRRVGDRSIN